MKNMLIVSALALVSASPAAAQTLQVTITGTDTASFTVDSSPTPSDVFDNGNAFSLLGDFGSYTHAGTPGTAEEIAFYNAADGGGFYVGSAETDTNAIFTQGAVLFSGPVSAPTFLTGPFTFTEAYPSGEILDTVTIKPLTAPAAVPEPASWAMMISGFGLIGGALRTSRRTVALAA